MRAGPAAAASEADLEDAQAHAQGADGLVTAPGGTKDGRGARYENHRQQANRNGYIYNPAHVCNIVSAVCLPRSSAAVRCSMTRSAVAADWALYAAKICPSAAVHVYFCDHGALLCC